MVGVLTTTAALTAFALATGVLPDSAARQVSDLAYPPVAFGVALVVLSGAARADRRERRAWTLVGLGVFALAIGEALWTGHRLIVGVDPPYPGHPDIAYLVGYAAMTAGVLLMPHARPARYERLRLGLDALAGTLAASLVSWRLLFGPVFESTRSASVAEVVVGLGYPIGDVIMLIALIILSTRRGVFLADARLGSLAAGLAIFAVGDTMYLILEMQATYGAGSSLDATWLVAYGFFAIAGGRIARTGRIREVSDRSVPTWQSVIPYVTVAGLFTLFAADLASSGHTRSQTVFTLGVFFVIIVILGRQWAAGRENRSLVERERGQLISVISHELRTPLTAVAGFLEVLVAEDDLRPDEAREMLETARQQAQHLGRIVTDLVAVSREELHSMHLNVEEVDLDTALRASLRSVGDCSAREMSLSCEPGLVALVDRDRLNQMVGNLLTNACRYGGHRVRLTASRIGELVEIAVEDDGPGVPSRFEDAIWERFERGAHRLDAQTPGSGLGLAVVRSLVLAHGGRFGYRSSRKLGGACFWFTVRAAGSLSPNGQISWPAVPEHAVEA